MVLITKEKMKAPPLYIPAMITRVFVSKADMFQLLASAKDPEMRRGPPIVPSSGVMVSVKLRRSAGSWKWVCMVDGRSSSVKSGICICMHLSPCQLGMESECDPPFWTRIWAALVFGFFLAAASSVFFMLHICEGVSSAADEKWDPMHPDHCVWVVGVVV